MTKPRSVVSILDLTTDEIEMLMNTADDIEANPEKYSSKCRGKILSTIFFEPSTRTRLSFESAMLSLGGSVISTADSKSSSAAKGESVSDTVRVISNYADIIVMRHPKEGAPVVAAMKSLVPVINAGDGGHFHPTQTLADLLTIRRTKGKLSGLTIGLCGDLMFGRTVHSLIEAMLRYPDNRYIMIAPNELRLPEYVRETLDKSGVKWEETESLEYAMPELDVLYMTRVQKERFFNEEDYIRLKDTYILDEEKLKSAKSDLSILHPLPRVNEISVAVDDDPRAKYFYQTLCGKQMRMALIMLLLGIQ
ncbi:MAG: aspartate carbamoyltransferase [Synergistaceae bacterium]|nr:aspartate carbamoyltransferase [Synergistaceae bacterium]